MQRRRIANGRNPQEARFAGSAQGLERGGDFFQDLLNAHALAAAIDRDRVVQMEDVHVVHAQPPQAGVHRAGDLGRDATECAAGHAHFRADNRVGGLQLGKDLAQMRLGQPVAVLHGGVEVVDPRVQRFADRTLLVGGRAAHH